MCDRAANNILAVMPENEWCDLYAITARLGYYPQSRYFGHVTKNINKLIKIGAVISKPGNLTTPLYKRVLPAEISGGVPA
jgi:hypothetical protein